MAAVAPQRHSPSSSHQYRHHPYASTPSSNSNSAASSSTQRQTKWQSSSSNGESSQQQQQQQQQQKQTIPPSPPRSRRDASETPSSLGLGVAFGGSAGGKWWEEELPAPPASLSSILDSFRRSGEGDRDLLLAILGAKKAEEERLTSLIQTRLTVLQARLSLHSAAAAVAQSQSTAPSTINSPYPGIPPQLEITHSSTSLSSHNGHRSVSGLGHPRGSTASSPNSPPLMTPIDETSSHNFNTSNGLPIGATSTGTGKKLSGSYWQSNGEQDNNSIRQRSRSRSPRRLPVHSHSHSHSEREDRLALPPIRLDRHSSHQQQHSRSVGNGGITRPTINTTSPTITVTSQMRNGSVSPKTSDERGRAANGLDMLLDAGMGRGSV